MDDKQTYNPKTVICNIAILRFGNFVFALVGLLLFMFFKDSENEQLFFVFYVGIFMLYNLIRFFILVLAYQDETIKATFSVPHQTGIGALSNNVKKLSDEINNLNNKANDGQV